MRVLKLSVTVENDITIEKLKAIIDAIKAVSGSVNTVEIAEL